MGVTVVHRLSAAASDKAGFVFLSAAVGREASRPIGLPERSSDRYGDRDRERSDRYGDRPRYPVSERPGGEGSDDAWRSRG